MVIELFGRHLMLFPFDVHCLNKRFVKVKQNSLEWRDKHGQIIEYFGSI
jgi:hypothetical protein